MSNANREHEVILDILKKTTKVFNIDKINSISGIGVDRIECIDEYDRKVIVAHSNFKVDVYRYQNDGYEKELLDKYDIEDITSDDEKNIRYLKYKYLKYYDKRNRILLHEHDNYSFVYIYNEDQAVTKYLLSNVTEKIYITKYCNNELISHRIEIMQKEGICDLIRDIKYNKFIIDL